MYMFGEENEDMEFEGFTEQLSSSNIDGFIKFKPF